jgi:hypothetical protein
VTKQHRETTAERRLGPVRVFKAIEANNDAASTSRRRAARFELSSRLRIRCCDAARSDRANGRRAWAGGVAIRSSRGRMFNSRAASSRMGAVFAEASARQVAIELDGNWHRQDIDFGLARRALAAGCIFALDSDAHSIGELAFTDYAIAHARLAGIPASKVVNCWSDAELERWMASRRLAREGA